VLSRSHSRTRLGSLLDSFRLGFTSPSFVTFSAMVRGFVAHAGERNVCGLLAGSM
jgi:hypothetical protein